MLQHGTSLGKCNEDILSEINQVQKRQILYGYLYEISGVEFIEKVELWLPRGCGEQVMGNCLWVQSLSFAR
jgi:hypothetical protein